MKISVQFILSFIAVLSASIFSASAQQMSDAKLKTNTAPLTNSLSYVNRLQPVTYQFNRTQYQQLNLPAGTQYGFIATDAQQVTPWAVTTRNNWYNAGKSNTRALTTPEVDLQKLVPLLVGAIQEQQAQIEQLQQEVQKLKQGR